jgi:N-acetylglucosamine-6-sulfatase
VATTAGVRVKNNLYVYASPQKVIAQLPNASRHSFQSRPMRIYTLPFFTFVFFLLSFTPGANATCTLPAPLNLKAINKASCQFTLKWKAVNGATNYTIQYKVSSASDWITVSNIGTVTSYILSGLFPLTAYDTKVAAVCSNGENGAFSSPITTTTLSCSVPAGLSTAAITSSSVQVTWSVPCGESTFKLSYRKTGTATWTMVNNIPAATYLLGGLEPATSYDVKVKSKCGSSFSAFSPVTTFTTAPSSGPPSRKNVLLVIIDDARFDTYAATGGPSFFNDVNISRVANEGVSFELGFPVMSQCAPSRASIVTGLYPHIHGVTTNPPTSVSDTITEITLPQILQSNGYYTGLIGKYHISKNPQPGYDYWMEVHNNDYTNTKYNLNGVNKTINGHQTDVITDSAIGFLHKVPQDKPFFLWFAYKAPHTPLVPRPEDEGVYDDEVMPSPDNFEKYTENYPAFIYNCHASYDSTGISDFYKGYFELLKGVDETLGEVFNELETMGLMDSTLIIFMSDNGYLLGEHYMLEKQVAYEESIHIPIFMRYPDLIDPAKKVKKQIATNIDIAPTILDFAGIPDTFGMQGVSLLQLMNKEVTRKEMMYEFFNDDCLPDIRAIRSLDYKYVQYNCSDVTEELFNLTADPEENSNLVNDEAYSAILQEYRDKLTFWRNYYQDFTWDSLYTCSLTNPQRLIHGSQEPLVLLNVFPNPAADAVTVHFMSSEGKPVSIRLYDILGNSVYSSSALETADDFSLVISLAGFPAGNYFLVVEQGSTIYRQLITHE